MYFTVFSITEISVVVFVIQSNEVYKILHLLITDPDRTNLQQTSTTCLQWQFGSHSTISPINKFVYCYFHELQPNFCFTDDGVDCNGGNYAIIIFFLSWISFSFDSIHRYSIEQSEGSEGYFEIEPISGIIRTIHLLDREDIAWHNITVTAKEEGGYHIGFWLDSLLAGFLKGLLNPEFSISYHVSMATHTIPIE